MVNNYPFAWLNDIHPKALTGKKSILVVDAVVEPAEEIDLSKPFRIPKPLAVI